MDLLVVWIFKTCRTRFLEVDNCCCQFGGNCLQLTNVVEVLYGRELPLVFANEASDIRMQS